MLELIQNFRGVIDAPLGIILACPLGIIAALHFASATVDPVKGARCDIVVIQAKAAAVQRPAWIKLLGVTLGLSVSIISFVHLQDPNFWPRLANNLPF